MKRLLLRIAALLICVILVLEARASADDLPELAIMVREATESCTELLDSKSEDPMVENRKFYAGIVLARVLMHRDDHDGAAVLLSKLNMPDNIRQRMQISLADEAAVRRHGKVPEIPQGVPPIDEFDRRREIALAFMKQRDFDLAFQQITQYPELPARPYAKLLSYNDLIEEQLNSKMNDKARTTLRVAWKEMEQLSGERADYKFSFAVGYALQASRLGEAKLLLKLAERCEELRIQHLEIPSARKLSDDLPKKDLNLAMVYARAGEAKKAREKLQQGLAAAKAIRPVGRFEAKTEAAEILLLLGDMDEANRLTESLVEDAHRIMQESEADSWSSIFETTGLTAPMTKLARARLTADQCAEAQRLWDAMPSGRNKLFAQIEIAKQHRSQGRDAEARACMERIAALATADVEPDDLMVIHAITAKGWLALDHRDAAKKSIDALVAQRPFQESADLRAQMARTFASLGLTHESYQLIKTVPDKPLRAVPLSQLAATLLGLD